MKSSDHSSENRTSYDHFTVVRNYISDGYFYQYRNELVAWDSPHHLEEYSSLVSLIRLII